MIKKTKKGLVKRRRICRSKTNGCRRIKGTEVDKGLDGKEAEIRVIMRMKEMKVMR